MATGDVVSVGVSDVTTPTKQIENQQVGTDATTGLPYLRQLISDQDALTCLIDIAEALSSAVDPTTGRLNVNAIQATAASLNATVTATNLSTNISQIGTLAPGVFQPTANTVATAAAALLTGASAATAALAEVSSAARTTSGNSGTIADMGGGAISGTVNVTAASGTTPKLDLVLQESPDGGTTWNDVWHVERITTTGVYQIPTIPVQGRRRWAWTIAGTTPSFTFSISATRGGAHPYPARRQYFDRVVDPATTNSVGSIYRTGGARYGSMFVYLSTLSGNPIMAWDLSPDQSQWFAASNFGTGNATSIGSIGSNNSPLPEFVRAKTYSGVATNVLGYACLAFSGAN